MERHVSEDSQDRWPRWARWLRSERVCAFLAIAFSACWISSWPDIGHDASHYLSIARSMAAACDGTSNAEVHSLGSRQLFYAPGYPALLAPLFATLGDRPFLAIALLHFGLTLAVWFAALHWLRRAPCLMPNAAPLLALLCVVHVSFVGMARSPLSELAFTALLLWAAAVLQCLVDRPNRGTLATCGLTLLGAALVAALAVTRHVGIFIAAGFGLVLASRAFRTSTGKVRAVLLTLAIGVPASAGLLVLIDYESRMAQIDPSAGQTYVDYLESESFLSRLEQGTHLRTASIGRLVVPGLFKTYASRWIHQVTLIHLLVACSVLWWWFQRARRQPDVLLWTFPIYLLFYCNWPFDVGTRFLLPVLPLLLLAVHDGLRRLGRLAPTLLVVFFLAHLAVSVTYNVRETLEQRELHSAWPDAERIAETILSAPGPVDWRTRRDSAKYFVQYELDRPLFSRDPRRDKTPGGVDPRRIDPHVRWVVKRQSDDLSAEPDLIDFEEVERVGERVLFRRRP